MSIANKLVTARRLNVNKAKVAIKMYKAAVTNVPHGDDMLYTFDDGSAILDRLIVNEWQVFKHG